jgi:hypothetical protein
VLFSYSFFFQGITGLAVTIGVVLTLAFFMVKTAHVQWDDVFPKRQARPTQGAWTPPPAQYAQQFPDSLEPNAGLPAEHPPCRPPTA